jgi:2,3-bisphosphoglycerate-independent phosphoglycerate mutase
LAKTLVAVIIEPDRGHVLNAHRITNGVQLSFVCPINRFDLHFSVAHRKGLLAPPSASGLEPKQSSHKRGLLLILDGFAYGDEQHPCNAVARANSPTLDRLRAEHPYVQIDNNQHHVGLPEGQMGNSEVGHLNIGAGRVLYQDFLRINHAIEEGHYEENEALQAAFSHVKKSGGRLHLMGILGPGGVHGHEDHWGAALMAAAVTGLEPDQVFLHPILDGRDTEPRSAERFLETLNDQMQVADLGFVATMVGRYFAMDRDHRWDRTRLAYNLFTKGMAERTSPDWQQAIRAGYAAGEDDEFIKPTLIDKAGLVRSGDACIWLNFRPDRSRQMTRAFMDPEFEGFERTKLREILWVCTTQYDDDFVDFPGTRIAYGPERPTHTLGQHISDLGLRQFRVSESEKYAHITYFLNGGREAPFPGEERKLIPSPKVATYDLQPEMNSGQVTDALLGAIADGHDLIVVNYPNGDMVGHTGNMDASIKAVEAMDACLAKVIAAAAAAGYVGLLTSDHGNCEELCYLHDGLEGGKMTAHSMGPSPLIAFGDIDEATLQTGGALCNVAPTLLDLMGLEKPSQMDASSLVERNS